MAKTKTSPEERPPQPVFQRPTTITTAAADDAMAVAEAVCLERGQRLTTIRRKVLAELLASHKPLGAYEIIDRIALRGARPAPITAYRRLNPARKRPCHRIESRNAFIACVHNHAAGALVVLICEHCGAVGEASSADLAGTLASAARAARSAPKSP